jgi:hypothetical protein
MFPTVSHLKFLFPFLVLLSNHTEATILRTSSLKLEKKGARYENSWDIWKVKYLYKKQLSLQYFLRDSKLNKTL